MKIKNKVERKWIAIVENKENVIRQITIEDNDIFEKLSELRSISEYSRSLNKLINDALLRGVPKLYSELFEPSEEKIKNTSKEESIYSDVLLQNGAILNTLKELTLHVILMRDMMESIYLAIGRKLEKKEIDSFDFLEYGLTGTPHFIKRREDYLKRGLEHAAAEALFE